VGFGERNQKTFEEGEKLYLVPLPVQEGESVLHVLAAKEKGRKERTQCEGSG